MPIFLIVLVEIVLFGYFSDRFGFLNTLSAYWIPTFILMTFLPFLLCRLQGLSLQSMDTSSPSLSRQLNRILVIVGVFALMIPLVTTRAIGVFLVLPGFRHLLLWKFKSSLQKKTNQYFGKFGNSFQFYYQKGPRGFGTGFEDFQQPTMKDVTPTGPQSLQTVEKIESSRSVRRHDDIDMM